MVAILLSALPHVPVTARPFVARAALGIGLLGLSDALFAVALWGPGYSPVSGAAVVNELGLLLLLDAALVGARPTYAATRPGEERLPDRDLLVTGAPFVPLAGACLVAFGLILRGEGVSAAAMVPVLLIGLAMIAKHVTSVRDAAEMVDQLASREQVARRLAETDALTGLPNRGRYIALLDAALADPACHPVAVALLDLNDFKDVNDTHGHATGDEILRRTAARLALALPDGVVSRLGGDEFSAFVPRTPDAGRSLGEDIAAAFTTPVSVGSRTFVVRPSVGVVVDERPAGSAGLEDGAPLVAHADVAMYEAKKSKDLTAVPVAVLTGATRVAAATTIRIRDDLTHPDLTEFRVVYQPVVDLVTGSIVGAEALLRWRHPDLGEISPATFIPIAEQVGTIGQLGRFVLGEALDEVGRWGAAYSVGVNVSPRQLTDPALADEIAAELRARDLHPDQLTIEVTEEALVDDMEAVVATIAALRGVGLSVAVDDFGTGYSSLRYLRRFDANFLKIDREFVQASTTEPRTGRLVGSVVATAEALDLRCVAEGLETLDQLELVRSLGCRLGQGFLLDAPLHPEAFLGLVTRGHRYPVHGDAVVEPALGRGPGTRTSGLRIAR